MGDAHLVTANTPLPDPDQPVSSRPAAEAFLAKICFKVGPPALVGVEVEWITTTPDGSRPSVPTLARLLGPHAPVSVSPDSPHLPLPDGSLVSVEPGGQLELSSQPVESVSELRNRIDRDTVALRELLRGRLHLHSRADDKRRADQVLTVPRYRAMRARYNAIGPLGRWMMCNTAAIQVCLDAGRDDAEIADRWQMLHDVGPALCAAFANSRGRAGDEDRSGPVSASARMRAWHGLDPVRDVPTFGAPGLGTDARSPRTDYPRRVLATPLLCVRRGDDDWSAPDITFGDWIDGNCGDLDRAPTYADLRYHATTVFGAVRPQGHLEVRYLDAQPPGGWLVPTAVLAALAATPQAVAEASEIARATSGGWVEAAVDGLDDPQLRSAAASLTELATGLTDDCTLRAILGRDAGRIARGERPHAQDTVREGAAAR
ncbi:glutamate-cysteine ligase family protein [Jongsikchunia kroppenstedtii]|uniref:glutamate-cysteine ligase family protein n=1 Tax=Jongsikchunia kroppenstedtii TaxID=1121721 RepID=UPI000362DDAC|nr:glutamate-cysteine ligase family protein [Jongsikchunia kroppenstedtii]